MTVPLWVSAACKFLLGVLLVGVLIFIPAGTLMFFNGWLLMGSLFIPMLIAGIIMAIKCPKLLEKRLNSKENDKKQDRIVKCSGLMFIIGFVMAGLGYRFGWSMLPTRVSWVAAAILLMSYGLYAEVLRENAYVSRTIQVEEGQKVVDTGLYSVVRHPMYSASVFLFLSMPLVLGSIHALIVFVAYPYMIVRRIQGEEKLLEKELEGYSEYKNKVKYRLIPYIW